MFHRYISLPEAKKFTTQQNLHARCTGLSDHGVYPLPKSMGKVMIDQWILAFLGCPIFGHPHIVFVMDHQIEGCPGVIRMVCKS